MELVSYVCKNSECPNLNVPREVAEDGGAPVTESAIVCPGCGDKLYRLPRGTGGPAEPVPGDPPATPPGEEQAEDVTAALEQRAVTRAKISAALEQQLDALQAIVDGPSPMTAAQLTSAVKTLARGQRRVIRLQLSLFDAEA